jgi:hypothetical protein
MDIVAIGQFIAQVGFPAALAIGVLLIYFREHTQNVEAINKLTAQIIVLTVLLSVATKIPIPKLADGNGDKK